MTFVRWVGFAIGVVVAVATSVSVVRTLVVPRGLTSWFSRITFRVVRAGFLTLAAAAGSYKRKDRILAYLGPVSLLGLLVTWLASFIVAYALLLWPLGNGTYAEALRAAGSATFTLGFVQPHGAGSTIVHLVAAATGLFIVAVQIAYLPTLYSSFNRREMLVTLLATRAGSPAWGPEILARHQAVGTVDTLPGFYTEWEQWAADVAETHSNYPVLNHFRSPHPLRNWVLGLLAVMDSAAMYLALCPDAAPSQARLFLRMGFTSLRDIARAIDVPFEPDPLPTDPVSLTYEEFLDGVARVERSGFVLERTPEAAWPHFLGWRVNYEALSYALADLVNAPPAAWSGPRTYMPSEPIELRPPVDRKPGDQRTLSVPRSTTPL